LWGQSVAQITKGRSTQDECGSSELEVMTKLVAPLPPFKPLSEP
jgi:hypothetical protein